MSLIPCPSCAELVVGGTCVCPYCGGKACRSRSVPGAAVLLGLSLVACGPEDPDPTGTPSGSVQADYSAPITGTVSSEATAAWGDELAEAILEYGPEQPEPPEAEKPR